MAGQQHRDTYIQPGVHECVSFCLKVRLTAVGEVLQLGLQLSANTPHLLHMLPETSQLPLNLPDLHSVCVCIMQHIKSVVPEATVVILWTHPGDAPLQVVFAHVGSLIADGLLCSLHRAAQVAAAALELLQQLQQDVALLLPARART